MGFGLGPGSRMKGMKGMGPGWGWEEPQNGWFVMKSPIKMADLGVP